MSFTVTSTFGTLVLDGLTAVYTATAHGQGGLLYVKYTKGNEDGIRIALSYGCKGLTRTDRYQHVSVNLSTRILAPTSYVITASGNYRIPVTWSTEEIYLTFTISTYGSITATGTIDMDYREAE